MNRLQSIAWRHTGGGLYASQTYVNDDDGRRTSMTREDSTAENYLYDATSQLTNATRETNQAVFIYDGRNRCVERTINGTTTTFIYDRWDFRSSGT